MAYKIEMIQPVLTKYPVEHFVDHLEEAKQVMLTCMDLAKYSPDEVQIIITKEEDKKEEKEMP